MSVSVALRHPLGALTLDVAFDAGDGVTVLFGRSGAGKTSIIQAVAGLLTPQQGRISIGGRVLLDTAHGVNLPSHKRRIGYVFQDGRLFPHLSVRSNLLFGRWFGRADGARLDPVVEMLGLGPLLARKPGALSGGEKQRVAIGRALLSRPDLLLMDEPLAALDAARKAEILPYLERLRDETQVPILYVSHSVSEVARLAGTLVAIEAGRVLRAGPVAEVLADPEAVPVLGVRDAGALLPATITAHDTADSLSTCAVSGGLLHLPLLNKPVGSALSVRIEAHDVMIARTRPEGLSALNVLEGEVASIRQGAGPGAAVALKVGQDMLLARVTRRSVRTLGLAPGLRCFAVIKSTSVAQQDIAGR